MTETSAGRAPSRRNSASTRATAPEPAEAQPAATPPAGRTAAPTAEVEPAAVVPTQQADGRTTTAVRTPMTFTIRLPFFTATFTGPGSAPPAGAPLAPVVPAAGRRDPGGTLEKMAFYGGVAAAGALGAIEWPVAAAVAAGTWVAQHTPPPAGLRRRITPSDETRKPAEPEPIAVTSDS